MQIEKRISFSCGGALDFVGTPRSASTLISNFHRRCRKCTSLLAECVEMCQHYFLILGSLLITNGRRSTPRRAAAATKAVENLGYRSPRRVSDDVLLRGFSERATSTGAWRIPQRLFQHNASSADFRTDYTNTRDAGATDHHVPKSKELASCLASS